MDFDLIRICSGKNRSALRLAERAHRGVTRKAADVPYLLHPVAVADVLAGAGADRDLICAGILHDTVEDTGVTLEQIRAEFGDEVAELVGSVTKDEETIKAPNRDKARLVIAKLMQLPTRALRIRGMTLKGADVLVNMTDLVLDAENEGIEHFTELFGDRAPRKIDHYLELAGLIADELDETRYWRLAKALRARAAELRTLRERL